MIRLHCTSKLLPKLPVDGKGCFSASNKSQANVAQMLEALNPLSGWYGSMFLLKGRNCVVMVHEATRFPVFMPCLMKTDFAELEDSFANAFVAALVEVGANEEQIYAASRLIQPFVVDDESKDVMQMALNQAKACIERMLWDDNTSIEKLETAQASRILSDIPFNLQAKKEVVWPKKLMLRLLDDAAGVLIRTANNSLESDGEVSEAPKSDNIVSMIDFQNHRK
ncbi:DUF6933 domain-containing protein [Marinomonas atlantica]|uniref:DUF6933 domain-containing protein n=1 Tax=Marinomonas atlantica TaxID=1806668 RepID=UPI000836DDA7|nr:hypothetical protein [Marinomonas atlantica]MCO4786097.1 hypothetical protein [Marinomonas atlantica]